MCFKRKSKIYMTTQQTKKNKLGNKAKASGAAAYIGRQMRRALLFCVAACLLFVLGGCSLTSQNVKDLLRAPALGPGQGEIQDALAAYLGEEPQYKFPKEGEWRSPLIRADLNGDGQEEGILLYSVANSTSGNKTKGNNVYIAVLEEKDGKWVVQADLDGADIEVASFSVVDLLGDGTKQILIGYASANLKSKVLTLYQYQDAALKIVYQMPYSRYDIVDFGEEADSGLVLVSPEDQVAGLQLHFLPVRQGAFLDPEPPVKLDSNFIACLTIAASRNEENEQFLVIDGMFDKGLIASQFVYFSGEHFYTVDDSGKMRAESGRLNPLLQSRDIDNDGMLEIPRRVGNDPIFTVNGDKNLEYIEWLDFRKVEYGALEPVVEQFGLLDSDRKLYIRLPEEWRGRIKVADGSQKGEWMIQNVQTLSTLLMLKTYEEDQTPPRGSLKVPGADNTFIVYGSSLTMQEELLINAMYLGQ